MIDYMYCIIVCNCAVMGLGFLQLISCFLLKVHHYVYFLLFSKRQMDQ